MAKSKASPIGVEIGFRYISIQDIYSNQKHYSVSDWFELRHSSNHQITCYVYIDFKIIEERESLSTESAAGQTLGTFSK